MAKFLGLGSVKIAGSAIGLASQIVLARILGADEFGQFTLVFTWVVLISLITRFGLDNYLIKNIAIFKAAEKWQEVRGLRKFSSTSTLFAAVGVAILFCVIVLPFDLIEHDLAMIFLVGLFVVLPFYSLCYFNQSTLLAIDEVVKSNMPILVLRHLFLIIGVTLVWQLSSIDAFSAMAVNALAIILSFGIGFFWIQSRLKNKNHRPAVYRKKEWLRGSLPFLWIDGVGYMYQRSDILILGFFATESDVGVYGAVVKIMVILTLASNINSHLLKPMAAVTELKKLSDRVRKIARMNFTLTILPVAVFFLFGRSILSLFGPEFEQGYEILLVLAAGRAIQSAFGPTRVILMMKGFERIVSMTTVGLAIINIIANIILVQYYGVFGVAIATGLVYLLSGLIHFYYVKIKLGTNPSIF